MAIGVLLLYRAPTGVRQFSAIPAASIPDDSRDMEDEGFVDDDFIEETAREFVGRYGVASVAVLRDHAALAEAAGDYLLAQTWREIVKAAEQMLP
ncbi:MAG: hypothetical protein AB7H71_01745 [Alphaproteobacteria bacterium]